MRCSVGLGLWVALAFCIPAWGDDWGDTLQVHGFASQALMSTTANNVFGETDGKLSLGLTELGINASVRPVPRLQLSGQLLSRRAGEGHDGDIQVDYALADYTLVSDEVNQIGVRVGRVKNPLGLYNDTRDVPFTRPSILLPQSIYFDRTRNVALSSDGVVVHAEHRTAAGDFFLEFGVGRPHPDLDTELALFAIDRRGELEGKLSYIGRLLFEQDGGRLRLAISAAESNTDYEPALASPPDLPAGSVRFSPWILSAQYNAEYWSITSEYARRPFESWGFDPVFQDSSVTGESYYLQGTYRFSHEWEGVLRYDALYRDKNDKDGTEYAAGTPTGRPAHSAFAKDWTAGVRWNLSDALMLRAEYHNVDGTAWLPVQDNPDPATTKRRWELYAILISYRF